MISKIVLKSDLWPESVKCGSSPKLYNQDLKSGRYRVPKLPPLSVKQVCSNSHKTNHPNIISKIVLKSVLWHCSESVQYFCIFQLLCFSLHPSVENRSIPCPCGQGVSGTLLQHCAMCCLCSMFSFQSNKLRHILKFLSWYITQHIFVPACKIGRKTLFSRKPWPSNSKFGISGSILPILSVPKTMFLVPENEKRNKF